MKRDEEKKQSFWLKFFVDLIITTIAGISILAAHASENDRIAEQIAAERNQNQIVNNQGSANGNEASEGFVIPDKENPEASVTYVPGPEIVNTQTPENTVDSEPTSTNTPVPTSTSTPVPTSTDTPVPTSTNTPVPTSTDTPAPTATETPVPTKTQAAVDTPVPTPGQMVTPVPTPTKFTSPTPMPALTATPTFTAVPTNTQKPTNTPRPTSTPRPTYTPTNTPTPTNTAKPSATPTNTPTAAPLPAEATVAIPVENWYPGLLSMKEESERIYYAYGGLEATDTQPLGIFAQVAKELWTYENGIEQLLEMFHGYVAEAGMNEEDYEYALDSIEKAYNQIELYKELIVYLENNAHENDYDFADADAEKLISSIDEREGIDVLLDKLVSDAYTKYLAAITPTNTPTPTATPKAKVTLTPTPTPTKRNTPTPIPTKKVTNTPTPKTGSKYVWTTKSTTLYKATSGSDYYVKIPKDTKISVTDYNSTWYIATYNGYTGYIKKSTNPSNAAPTPTPTPTRVPPVITESDFAQRMVHQARLELEEYMLTYGSVPMAIPDSENKYVHENGRTRDSVEWCAVFIMWVADHAGVPDSIVPNISETNSLFKKDGFGTALSWVRGLKTYMTDYWGANYYSLDSYTTSRQNYVPYTPKPGDLIFYKSNTKGEVCHIGIVVEVDTNKKTCTTIEGNTSDTFNLIRTGDCVGQKTRYYEKATVVEQSSASANDGWYIAGFLHPLY